MAQMATERPMEGALHKVSTSRDLIEDDVPHKQSGTWGGFEFPEMPPGGLDNRWHVYFHELKVSELRSVLPMFRRGPNDFIGSIC